jgi:hypothetical protein
MSTTLLGLAFVLAAGAPAQPEPQNIRVLMTQEAARIKKPIVAAIPAGFDVDTRYRSWVELSQDLDPVRIEDGGQIRLVVYNSDWLLPQSAITSMGAHAPAVMDALLQCFGQASGLLDAAFEGGVQGHEVPRSNWERLGNALRPNLGNVDERMRDGKGTLTLGLQRGVKLYDSDGEYLAEVSWVRDCADGLENLRKLYGGGTKPAPIRCPPELENAVRDGLVPMGDEGVSIRKLPDLIEELAPNVSVPLRVDRRVEDMRLAFATAGVHLSRRQLMRIVPETLDMYWRKVGGIWLLAASPDYPPFEWDRRVAARVALGMSKVGELRSNNKDDFALVGSPDVSLGSLSAQQRQAFADLVFKCADPESREKIQGLMKAGKLGPGTTLRHSLMIHYNVSFGGAMFSSQVGG